MVYRHPARRPHSISIGEEVASWLPVARPPYLTERQWDVLSRLAAGHPASRVAADLGLSRQRVYQIVAGVRRKLGDPARRT